MECHDVLVEQWGNTRTISVSTEGDYTCEVTTPCGSISSDHIVIKVLSLPETLNTFTPNGDGINDAWMVQHLDTYPSASLDIFNWYGARVCTAKGFLSPWDVKSNGVDLPVGTYYYIFNPGLGRKTIAGQITILK